MMDWYPWYFTIYKTDTLHLDPYQDGCYRRLIDYYMETRQALPDNDVALARIVGDSQANWEAMASAILRAFFTARGGRLYHKKCEKILQDQEARTKKLSESGKNGAKKRWKNNNDLSSQPIATPNPDDSTLQDTTGQKVSTPCKPPKGGARAEHPDFETWYQLYPHKVGRAAALSAFTKAVRKADLTTLMAGLGRYLVEKPPDRSWCNPATWLNQERWNDKPQEINHENTSRNHTDRLKTAGDSAVAELLADFDARHGRAEVLAIAGPD